MHGFALLMWLHRRSEEFVEQIVNYYRMPIVIPRQDVPDHLLTPKSSNLPLQSQHFSNKNYSPETKIFLHGSQMLAQSPNSSQSSPRPFQTAFCGTQLPFRTPQKSNSNSKLSQISCSPDTVIKADGKNENSAFIQPVSQKTYSTPLSQTVYNTLQHTSKDTSPKSNLHCKNGNGIVLNLFSQNVNPYFTQISEPAQHASQQLPEDTCKNQHPTLLQPTSQEMDIHVTQLSQSIHDTTQHTLERTPRKTNFDSNFSQIFNSTIDSREYCEAENTGLTQPLSQMITPNAESVTSPTQSKFVKKVPHSQNKIKVISPKILKKQNLLNKKVSLMVKQPKIHNFFIKPKSDLDDGKPQIKNLFMGEIVKNFLRMKKGTVEDFTAFAEKQMTEFLCTEAEKLTRIQGTDLWMDLRYGRITASIINEAANCKTINGSLVNKILGKAGRYQSPAMKRGINLESKILYQVQLQENLTTSSAGLFLVPWCPIIGASPDAIGKDFIVEIKAPTNDSSFQTFLPSGNISKKCKSQMYMQMYCTGMKRGIFCVADPNFEINKKVTTVWLDYDDEFNDILESAKLFWYTAIFPRLVNL